MRPRALRSFALALFFVALLATGAAAQTSATIAGTIDDPNRSVLPGVTVTIRNVATSLSRTVVTRPGGPLRHRRPAAGRLRAARRAHQLQAARAARPAADDCPVAGRQHHPRGRRPERGGDGGGRHVARQHLQRRAQFSRRIGSDRSAAAERPQLHGPRAAAARRARLSASRRRLGGGARARHERERAGSALERLPARRHAAERLHQRPGRQRRRHGARHRNDSRVPRRIERLQRRVRPQLRRSDQRADQVGRQQRRRLAVRVPSQRGARRPQLFRRRRAARLPSQPVRRHDRRTDRARSRVLLPRLRGARRAARQDDRHVRARRQRAQRPAAERTGDRSARRSRPTSRNTPAPTDRRSDRASPATRSRSTSASTSTSRRAGSTTASAAARSSSRATRSTIPTSSCRRTIRSFPATSSRGISSSPAEYRRIVSPNTVSISRIGFSRTRIGQNVQANTSQPLPTFVATRDSMGDIDIGGLRRFGPQSSGNLRLVQNVFSAQSDLVQTRGRHVLKAGALAEHYQDNMVNPTFSLGIFTFADLSAFLGARAASFVGLTPEAQFDRYWRFTLFGFYSQDDFQVSPRVTAERRAALRVHDHAAREVRPRLGAARPLRVDAGRRSALREPHLHQPLAAPGRGVGRVRQRPDRRSRRLRALLQHQQPSEPDRDGDQSAVHAAPGHRQPDVPESAVRSRQRHLDAAGAVRPRQPARARLQRQRAAGSLGTHRRHRRLRRLARPAPAAQRRRQPGAADRHHGGRPAVHRRRNAADQHGVLDHRAEEQRRRLVVQRAHLRSAPPLEPGPFAAVVVHVLEERGHDAGLDLLLRRDQRHHVGAARVRARLQPRTVRLRHAATTGS